MASGPTEEDREQTNVLLCWIGDCLCEDLMLSVAGCIGLRCRLVNRGGGPGTVDVSC
jgi:hypothetical protein